MLEYSWVFLNNHVEQQYSCYQPADSHYCIANDFLCMTVYSYGRVEELVYYAGLKEQYETLIHHFVQVVFFLFFFANVLLAYCCNYMF